MAEEGIGKKIRAALSQPDTLPSMRRYFVNTMFDATFVMLGVIIGSALSSDPRHAIIITTMLTSTVSLAISTGTSVYEAESLEQSRRMNEIGRAMLTNVEDTDIGRASRTSILLIAAINMMAPLMTGLVLITPFLFISIEQVVMAAEIAIGLAITMMFITGFIMGRTSGKNPFVKGARMAVIGIAAFVICYLIGGAV
ncbi:MAG: VIT family protein [Methanomassiliicoccales archaeon PtaU1.Bin124]|nr:MAG: VIT family protein [Methanomassiliicoccales archaeon PtaU1.Bin124]